MSRQDEADLLKIGFGAGGNDFLAVHWFRSATHEERIHAVQVALEEAGQKNEDKVGIELFALLENMVDLQEELAEAAKPTGRHYGEAAERAKQIIRSYVADLYWKLPNLRFSGYSSRQDPAATMVETKMALLKRIIGAWLPQGTKESREAFGFIIAVCYPLPTNQFRPSGESVAETKARGRMVFPEEREKIFALIRDHISFWKADQLDPWILEPRLPADIQKILIITRARNGGMELVRRELEQARILQPLDSSGRSPAVFAFLERFFPELRNFDARLAQLREQMRPAKHWSSDKDREIGGSEMVLGEITVEISSLQSALIRVTLEKDCSRELGMDIAGRVRRHVRAWVEKNSGIDISLEVNGGKGNLCIAETQRIRK
ncbi:MAG: hypothetical protein AAB691_01060 [Patescibacteria group bacterium]